METKRFTKNDDGFVCARCGAEVRPLGYSSRNHCPFCLWSLHVDTSPATALTAADGAVEVCPTWERDMYSTPVHCLRRSPAPPRAHDSAAPRHRADIVLTADEKPTLSKQAKLAYTKNQHDTFNAGSTDITF